jgi:thioredoxin 1
MINFSNFEQKIVANKPIALLTFVAGWCKPSKLQKEVIEELKKEFADQVIIELIDVDTDEPLSDKFKARTLPSSVLYADGELIEVLPGYQTHEFLQSYLQHIITEIEKKQQQS